MSVRSLLSCLLVALAATACSRSPDDVREWLPSDHDNTENPGANQGAVSDGGQMGIMGVDEVALAAWRANCVQCHGVVGRGDGPRGPEKKARNLTDPAWQASVTDEQIAASIRNGKGNMPAADLPDSTVVSLVRLVRLLNPDRSKTLGDAGAASDASVADAAPGKQADAAATKPKPTPPKNPAPPPPAGSGAAP